jgi:hypothetical protein
MPGQLRHRTPPCGRVTAANIRHQCRFGGCERHLEMEGQAIFIDSEHERNIEQKKNIQQEATLYPGLPIILASGYSHVLADEGACGFALLNKPYSMDQLSSILRKGRPRRHSSRVGAKPKSWRQAGPPRSLRRNPWSGPWPHAINP